MNRRQLAARLAEKTGLSVRRADQVLQVLPGLVTGELAHAGRLEWRGLGTFAVRRYPPRQLHVPSTGQTIDLPARAGVTFKPSRGLLSELPPPQPAAGHPSVEPVPQKPRGSRRTTAASNQVPSSPPPPPGRKQRMRPVPRPANYRREELKPSPTPRREHP